MDEKKIAAAAPSAGKKPAAKATANATAKAVQGIPPYLVVLLVILGLVGGYALFTVFSPPAAGPPANGGEPEETPAVNTILLYSDNCPGCDLYNSFMTIFQQNNIQYRLEKIEVGSDAGKSLVSRYGVEKVPALLIDVNSVVPNHLILTSDGMERLSAQLKGLMVVDRYVVPELNLEQDFFHPVMYLGNPDTTCSAEERPSVLIFCDPYSLACITNKPAIEELWEKFGEEVNFEYRYAPMPAYSIAMISQYGGEEAEFAINAYLCAQESGNFLEMQDGIVGLRCDKTGDKKATLQEIELCAMNNPDILKPLDPLEINSVIAAMAKSGSLDLNAFFECQNTIDEKKQAIVDTGDLFYVRGVPTLVVDCRHVIRIEGAEGYLCGLHPELSGCS